MQSKAILALLTHHPNFWLVCMLSREHASRRCMAACFDAFTMLPIGTIRRLDGGISPTAHLTIIEKRRPNAGASSAHRHRRCTEVATQAGRRRRFPSRTPRACDDDLPISAAAGIDLLAFIIGGLMLNSRALSVAVPARDGHCRRASIAGLSRGRWHRLMPVPILPLPAHAPTQAVPGRRAAMTLRLLMRDSRGILQCLRLSTYGRERR